MVDRGEPGEMTLKNGSDVGQWECVSENKLSWQDMVHNHQIRGSDTD